jgi:hypothetical protein
MFIGSSYCPGSAPGSNKVVAMRAALRFRAARSGKPAPVDLKIDDWN